MERTAWWDWVQRLMDAEGLTPAGLSYRAGVDQSVIGRWRDRGAQPSPENVRKIANALGQSVRQGAIQAGHYRVDELTEAGGPVFDPETIDLAPISDERWARETYRRMHAGSAHGRPSGSRCDIRPMPAHLARSIGGVNGAAEAEGAR